MEVEFLSATLLFRGIAPGEIASALECLHAEEKSYEKGAVIYRVGDSVRKVGLLLSGAVSIENDDIWGNKTVLSIVKPGQVFAETYACIPGEPMMVSVVAISKSSVLYLDMQQLLQVCGNGCPFHHKLIRNLLTISATKNLNLSRRSFHTAAKSIRGRLLSYLSYEATRQGSCAFDIPFNRQQLADYLSVDRSALSNEIGKMAKEGLLTAQHNHFVIAQDSLKDYR